MRLPAAELRQVLQTPAGRRVLAALIAPARAQAVTAEESWKRSVAVSLRDAMWSQEPRLAAQLEREAIDALERERVKPQESKDE